MLDDFLLNSNNMSECYPRSTKTSCYGHKRMAFCFELNSYI